MPRASADWRLVAVRARRAGAAARQDSQGQEDARRSLWRAAIWHKNGTERGICNRYGDAKPADDGRTPTRRKLLKPFLKGENIKRWRVESAGAVVDQHAKGESRTSRSIRRFGIGYLPFKARNLRRDATQQEWLGVAAGATGLSAQI